MIEATIISYLSSVLSVPVYAERPMGNIPDAYVVVDNTGTGETNYIKTSVVAFQSYGVSLYAAAQLNDLVVEAVKGLINLDVIGSARLNSAYNFSDTASKVYRYQAVFNITHY